MDFTGRTFIAKSSTRIACPSCSVDWRKARPLSDTAVLMKIQEMRIIGIEYLRTWAWKIRIWRQLWTTVWCRRRIRWYFGESAPTPSANRSTRAGKCIMRRSNWRKNAMKLTNWGEILDRSLCKLHRADDRTPWNNIFWQFRIGQNENSAEGHCSNRRPLIGTLLKLFRVKRE